MNNMMQPWHLKWVGKNQATVTAALNENICWQLVMAGVGFVHINKWREWRRLPRITHYTTKNKQIVRYFTGGMDSEQREMVARNKEVIVIVFD